MTYDRVLAEFGRDNVAARRKYRQFVEAGLAERLDSPWREAVHGVVLGSEHFVERTRRLLDTRADDRGVPALRQMRKNPTLATIIEATARTFGEDAADWRQGRRDDSLARAAAAYLARCRFGHSAGETAKALGYAGPSSVTRAVRRVENHPPGLSGRLAKIENACANH